MRAHLLPAAAALQLAFALLCLPAAGTTAAARVRKLRPGGKWGADGGAAPNAIVVRLDLFPKHLALSPPIS